MNRHFDVQKAVLNDGLVFQESLGNIDGPFVNNAFHYPNFLAIIECAAHTFSVRLTEAETSVDTPQSALVGLAAFDVQPLNQFRQNEDIFEPLQKAVSGLTPFNTLFLSFFYLQEGRVDEYLELFRQLAVQVASDNPHVESIVFCADDALLADHSTFLDFFSNRRVWKKRDDFLVFSMVDVIPRLNFRKAREEDQDDLSAISEAQTNLLCEQYGKFFLAEIISSEDTNKVCVVAETENKRAVGLAVVSSDLNFNVLAENYDLREYNYFTKGDYFPAFQHRQSQIQAVAAAQEAALAQKRVQEREFLKMSCSKTWLILELQEFCSTNKSAFLNEFQVILADPEKHKLINKNIMKRKLEKLLKGHTISKPHEFWARDIDLEVSTCIMTTSDLLLETLRHFDLPVNYLDGEGHWSFWIKRKQEEKNEEAKQKGILGKKKSKAKKRKADDGKDNQLVTPQHFDVEPFYVALQNFVNANTTARETVCHLLDKSRNKISALFYQENGELREGRVVDLGEVLEQLTTEEQPETNELIQSLIPYVLISFGELPLDVERVIVSEIARSKTGKTKERTNERVLRKVSYDEFFGAIEKIRVIDRLFSKRGTWFAEVETKTSQELQAQVKLILEKTAKNFGTSHCFPDFPCFDLHSKIEVPPTVRDVPLEVRNAVCCTIFFIDEKYDHCSAKFLQSIFELVGEFDFLILTLPHNTPSFKLLDSFVRARPVPHSNFPHNMFVFYKANLLNKFASVRLDDLKNLRMVSSEGGARSEESVTQYSLSVTLKVPGMADSSIGKVKARRCWSTRQLSQFYDISETVFLDAYAKNDAIEITEFDLHFVFKRLQGFILREVLRLCRAKLLVRAQHPAALAQLPEHFLNVKSIGLPKLVLGPQQTFFGRNLIRPRFALAAKQQSSGHPASLVHDGHKEDLSLACNPALATTRMLLNERPKLTARIIIIGASSCALSFIEEVLNHPHIDLTSLTLVAESVDWEPHVIQFKPLKVEQVEAQMLPRSLLERVNVIIGQVFFLDRKIKMITVKTHGGREFQMEYDYLIFANGLEEKTLEAACDKKNVEERIPKARNILTVDKLNASLCEELCLTNNLSQFYFLHNPEKTRLQGFEEESSKGREYGAIRPILASDEAILTAFKERNHVLSQVFQNKIIHPVVLYGASIEVLVVLEQLVGRWGVRPENIVLVIPRNCDALDKEDLPNIATGEAKLEFLERLTETPVGLNNKRVREFYWALLAAAGVTFYQNHKITDIGVAESTLNLKNMSPLFVEAKTIKDMKGSRVVRGNLDGSMSAAPKHGSAIHGDRSQLPNESLVTAEEAEETIDFCLLVTGDVFDISYQVFRNIQDNGLVYNGRLIVQSNFQTIDEAIFGAGRICEFSQRYKSLSLGKSLRMDKYNQNEVGKAMAQSFVAKLTGKPHAEGLHNFQEPTGMSAKLLLGFHVVELEFPFQGKAEPEGLGANEVSDLLNDEARPEYVLFGFDKHEVLRRFFYFGRREINLEVVRNILGLHRSYFNKMFRHQANGSVVSLVDYLNEGWAKAIFHPMFSKFKSLAARMSLPEDDGVAPEHLRQKLVEENVMTFIVDNPELFDFYFVPDTKKRFDI
jgi:hypothetical protein